MESVFIVQVIQVVSAILLVVAILIQRSEAGVGGAFGGGDVSESASIKRRGSEKVVFVSTCILAIIFTASIMIPLIVG